MPQGSEAPYETPPARDFDPTPEYVARTLEELSFAHPCLTHVEPVATTHLGRTAWALGVGEDLFGPAPSVFLVGAHHGDEPGSVAFVLDAARWLLGRYGHDPEVNDWLGRVSFWLVPLLNPDGLVVHRREARRRGGDPSVDDKRSPGRKNGRDNDGDGRFGVNDGVDLNRNYPFKWGFLGEEGSTKAYSFRIYRGPAAASEPETQGVIDLAQREVFATAMSFHVGGVALLVPYTIDRVRSPEPNEAWAVAEQITRGVTGHPSVVGVPHFPFQRNLYSVDGTDQDWHRHTHGTLAYIVEGALRGTAPSKRPDAIAAVRQIWTSLVRRMLTGPTVMGRVVDPEGKPVAAEVHLGHRTFYEGESWRARCRDGTFVRMPKEEGTVTVRVRHEGQEVVREVEVDGLEEITIRLPQAVKQHCPH